MGKHRYSLQKLQNRIQAYFVLIPQPALLQYSLYYDSLEQNSQYLLGIPIFEVSVSEQHSSFFQGVI